MSDQQHANGDTAPRGLRNALAIIRSSAKQFRKRVRQGFRRAARKFCRVCGSTFDPAIVSPDAQIQSSLCTDCRLKLQQGYTACVTTNPDAFAFVKSPYLASVDLAGQIVPMSQENFAKVKEKYAQRDQDARPDEAGQG